MKKVLAITLLALTLTGCGTTTPIEAPKAECKAYIASGRYYSAGQLITNDGNIWGYTQDIISEKPSYDNEPVYAVFNDNGTPDVIEDDIIEGLVFDMETAIYDALEQEFSQVEGFTVERTNNNIKIGVVE